MSNNTSGVAIDKERWSAAQVKEAGYWRNCNGAVAWGEFVKHEMDAREMGLFSDYGDECNELDMQGKSVLDVGGGPVSMTLRCYNAGQLLVVDPCNYPSCVERRYYRHGINFLRAAGEDLDKCELVGDTFDEVWIYNLLQHVRDPEKIVQNALERISPTGCLRMFEWLWIPSDECHPHTLTPEDLMKWLHGSTTVRVGTPRMVEHGCNANAFVGIFTRAQATPQVTA